MIRLRVVLFGKPAVYWDGSQVRFPFAKMEAMLYYLSIVGEATREKLASLFWGDQEDEVAKKNLRNTIYLLKKLLSADVLVAPSRTNIALNPVLSGTDYGDLLDKLERRMPFENCPGQFLEGFVCKDAEDFNEWVMLEQERLNENITSRLTKGIIVFIQEKNYSAAKQYCKHLISLDEYNEDAYRILMKIHERDEELHRVVDIYRKLEKKFIDELKLRPSAKTQEIYNRVKQKRAIIDMPAEDDFFGRQKELQQLTLAIEQYLRGEGSRPMLMVEGEQGVGKTTLLKRLMEQVPIAKASVLTAQCYQSESGYAHKSWSIIMAQTMKLLKQHKIAIPLLWQRVLAYIFPALAAYGEHDEQDVFMVPCDLNTNMVEEIICGVLGLLAKQRRLILFIDDVQWMGLQDLSVLHRVLQSGNSILCVAACHAEYKDRIEKSLWDFRRSDMIEKIHLDCFSRDETRIFAEGRLLPQGKITAELHNKLYEYTGGNALFLTECGHLLKAGQELSEGTFHLQNILKERIGSLSDDAQKILEASSVFFKYATYHDLQVILSFDEFKLVEAIEELEQKKLLVQTDDAARGLIYKFYNLHVRDFVYGKMSDIRKKLFHQRVGAELERQLHRGLQTKDIFESILQHYTLADVKAKMLEYTIKLAEKYFCPQYEMFPELTEYYPSEKEVLGEARRQAPVYLGKIAELLQNLSPEEIEPEQLVIYKIAYLEMLGRYNIWNGEHFQGIKVIHRLLRLATARKYNDYLLKAYQQMIFCGIQVGRTTIVKKYSAKFLNIATEENMPEKIAVGYRFIGLGYALCGETTEAQAYYTQSIALFKKLAGRTKRYTLNIAAAHNYIGNLRRDEQDWAAALEAYEQAIRIVGQEKISEGVAIFYFNAGYSAYRLGDYEKAKLYLGEAVKVGEAFGDYQGYWYSRNYFMLYCVMADIAVQEKEITVVREYVEKAEKNLLRYQDFEQKELLEKIKLSLA